MAGARSTTNRPTQCSRLRRLLLAGCLLLPLQLRAEDEIRGPVKLPRGLILDSGQVRRGDLTATLVREPSYGFTLSKGQTQAEYRLIECPIYPEAPTTAFTLDMMEARLENAAALKLHRSQRYEEAIPGFRKAARLDLGYFFAGYNLASALTLTGKLDEAAAALGPYLARNLPKVYLAILQDAELAPLLAHPTIAALRPVPPGTAILKEGDNDGRWDGRWVAASVPHRLLAALDPHDGLRVFSLQTGAVVATVDMGSVVALASAMDEEAPRRALREAKIAFKKALPLANRLLADLGFQEVKSREQGRASECVRKADQPCLIFKFPRSRIEVEAIDDGPINTRRDGRLLATRDQIEGTGRVNQASYLPELQATLINWGKNRGRPDCGRQGGTMLSVPARRQLPTPGAAAPPGR